MRRNPGQSSLKEQHNILLIVTTLDTRITRTRICNLSRISYFALLAILCFATPALATWNKVGHFNDSFGCGFFFDSNHGFVGAGVRSTGGFSNPITTAIYRTTNGGKTWLPCATPQADAVTSIYMRNTMTGYASVFGNTIALWQTVNGGLTWTEVPGAAFADGSCVYATPSAITLTNWDGRTLGGFSPDGGASWREVFTGRFGDRSNGVDFSDDNTGVATLGPGAANGSEEIYYTADGGLTWRSSTNAVEAWGVYAVKGSQTFFTANEGAGDQNQHSIYWSRDGGRTWNPRFTFPDPNLHLTGHVAGKGQSVYVQSDTSSGPFGSVAYKGMFRSDDLGGTWHAVGGPTYSRDSRFVVTGCSGEVVYAFDDAGNIWKTTDGGDGTLVPKSTPEFVFGTIPNTLIADTVSVPIYLVTTKNIFSISSFTLHISFNGDVLTPESVVTKGTLTEGATTASYGVSERQGATVTITMPKPITNTVDFTKPLVLLRMRVTLSDSTSTGLTLDNLLVNPNIPLNLCSLPSANFTAILACGDSTISGVMRKQPLAQILSVYPNPSHAQSVSVQYQLPSATETSVFVISESGEQVASPVLNRSELAGMHSLQLDTRGWAPGAYIVELRTTTAGVSRQKLIEIR
jgi:photosystem II stability/assembly factor-like uncharacterized protein